MENSRYGTGSGVIHRFFICGLDVGMLCVFFQPCLKAKHSSSFFGCAALLQQGHIWSEFFSEFHVKFCNITIDYVDFCSDYVEAFPQKSIHLYSHFLYCVCMRKGNGIRDGLSFTGICASGFFD